jgi:Fe(3+) dicitrate transport protein
LRTYHTHGLESRFSFANTLGKIDFDTEIGVRVTYERQARVQINADTPTARTPGTSVNGGVRERNLRYAEAVSLFALTKARFGNLTVSPGIRFEDIAYERVNQLNPAAVITGQSSLSEVIPSLGMTYALTPRFVAYGGVHRGFAPPRVEDVISNTTGGSVDLASEISTNYELGLRGTIVPGLNVDAAWFRLDFENQIVPQSVAGGVGTSLTSAGKTLHQGFEASTRMSLREMGHMTRNDLYARAAITWVRDASYEGARFSGVSGFSTVSVAGNRLPYAPEWLLTAAIGYEFDAWGQVQLEYVRTDEMFTDDLNTIAATPDGQRGLIKGTDIFNATLNVKPKDWKVGFYVAVKNLTDQETIVDRARGILPGSRRLFQLGLVANY